MPDESPTEPVRLKQEINRPREISCESEGVSLKSVVARKILSIANIKGDDRLVQAPVARTRTVAGANVAYTSKIAVKLKCDATISQQIAK